MQTRHALSICQDVRKGQPRLEHHPFEPKLYVPGWLFFYQVLQGTVAATQFCVALVLDSLCSAQPMLRDSEGSLGFF